MLTLLHTVYSKNRIGAWGCYILCCFEEAGRHKKVDHIMVNHDIATVQYMTPNKNGKVIFVTH